MNKRKKKLFLSTCFNTSISNNRAELTHMEQINQSQGRKPPHGFYRNSLYAAGYNKQAIKYVSNRKINTV